MGFKLCLQVYSFDQYRGNDADNDSRDGAAEHEEWGIVFQNIRTHKYTSHTYLSHIMHYTACNGNGNVGKKIGLFKRYHKYKA